MSALLPILTYHVGAPITIVNNTGIYNMIPQVSFNSLGTTISISVAWSDDGPGGSFPPVGQQQLNYSTVPNQVSYLQLSTGAWQCEIDTNYTAQPAFVGQLYRNVLELWTPDGLTKLKGPASGSVAETAFAQGFDEWKTNPGTITVPGGANAPSYLMKVWSKDELTGAVISNTLQFILTQGQSTGTEVNPIPGPWDVSYKIKKGAIELLPAQVTAGITQKTFSVSRDNPIHEPGSDFSVEITVKRSTEATGEVMTVPITVIATDGGGSNLTTNITNSIDGTPIAPGGTSQVLVNQALAFNVIGGKLSYAYNFRYGTDPQGTLITDPQGNGIKVFTFNAPGTYSVNIQDPLSGITSGWTLTATTGGGGGTECQTGYHWDPGTSTCVADTPQCPTGYHWDQVTSTCVADTPGGGGGGFLDQIAKFFSNPAILVGTVTLAAVAITKGRRK